ncbi:MAG TPA: hypothetical protein PLD20_26975 [Blastocatellia bacterium]|nr:hypothetical protein [Blastocatellia bacterium]HMY74270.1 hypothetical protein [Blastocatellia bacterium]HMZ21607.1 hypothetical protein [Blastocatellia bacterium]HNG28799.1 hypothetical protein [Blastocatellia bacterium]
MSLQTRMNSGTGEIEVLVNDQWVRFEDYRKKQIDDAYQSSVRFLRERLGEDDAKKLAQSFPTENAESNAESND